MRNLKRGDTGADVAEMQRIIGVTADGVFGPNTQRGVRRWQVAHGLNPDGVWGPRSRAAAMKACPVPGVDAGYPPEPSFAPIVGNAARAHRWGHIEYVSAPTSTNPEAIRITNGYRVDNIISVHIPQLRPVVGAPSSGRVSCHRDVAGSLQSLWAAWDAAGLMPLVRTWNGMWSPRFIRGSRTTLSNHAFGTAFDINYPWNMLGRNPAPRGEKGSVFDLVPLANEHGWYWGGFYSGRLDGMHFEHAGR